MLPGAQYSAPEFNWKFEVSPGGITCSTSISPNRAKIGVDDPRLEDRVADNNHKFDITESESLLIGTDFGVVTDIETGPNGNLFLVSLDQGEVHEISRR